MESLESKEIKINPERAAERKLEDLLNNPLNAFLVEHKRNFDQIENAETSVEALQIAEGLILNRLEGTFHLQLTKSVEGVKSEKINAQGIRKTIDTIKEHHELIGEGVDALVVIAKNEISELPP